MLKIKEPIRLKNKNICSVGAGLKGGDGLYERISSAYSMLDANISSEDLLHLVTQPPEVFLAEGDETNIFNNNINLVNNNEKKVEILNNLINRILISKTDNFTYRDSVYINNVLRRLGVTDVSSFMKQVYQIMEEHDNTQTQITLLSESINQYLPAKGEADSRQKKTVKPAAYEEGSDRHPYFLHQLIMDRLNTRQIYETIAEFVREAAPADVINQTMFSITEQIRTGDHLQLQSLQNEITMQNVPLVYQHDNYYEEEREEYGDELTVSNISNHLTKAVLLALIDKAYELKAGDLHEHNNSWFYMSDAFYESVSNTIERYARNLAMPVLNEVRQSFTISEMENNNLLKESLVKLRVENNEQLIVESLNQINEQNIQNQNQFIRALEGLKERSARPAERRKTDGSRQRRESLMALDNPQALLAGYEKKTEEAAPAAVRVGDEKFRSELPPQVLQYLELVENVRVNPGEYASSDSAMASLTESVREIEELKRQSDSPIMPDGSIRRAPAADEREAALVHRSSPLADRDASYQQSPYEETVTSRESLSRRERIYRTTETQETITTEMAREIVEKIISGNVTLSSNKVVSRLFTEDVSFVHKEQETINEEELLELLRQERLLNSQNTQTVNETNETVRVINHHEVTKEVVNELVDNNKLANLVSKSVQQQLGELSNQVYSRLEKRLANEKRRRGI